MKPRYQDLYFGKSDSRNEFNLDRDAFVRSYVDLHNASKAVLDGQYFLVLGPKGTGKSALAWYLEARETEGSHLVLIRDASTLPLAEVPRLQTGQPSGPERTVVAWKFILLCNYLEIALRDQTSSVHADSEAGRVTGLLREFGFMGDAPGHALLQASKSTMTIPVDVRGAIYKQEGQRELNIYTLLPHMERWATMGRSAVRHVLLLDGLDSIFLNDLKYDESLSSLVQAAYSLNQALQAARADGSIVLLLRNDVFARIALSLPDSQKMRDDSSIDLDWRVLTGPAGTRTPLFGLVNDKASHYLGLESLDVLSYFPTQIEVGGRKGAPRKFPTLQYLLNMTRHTPRDLLRLFEEIRKVADSGIHPTEGYKLSGEIIREGVLQYATKYFVGAIRNEFAGFSGGPESAELAITALKNIGRQKFSRQEFAQSIGALDARELATVDRLLTLLFFAGAIGNVIGTSGGSYLQFYHRRDESQIYLYGQFLLHNALTHAWAIPYSSV